MPLPDELRATIAKYFPLHQNYSIKIENDGIYLTYDFHTYQNTLEFWYQPSIHTVEHNLLCLAALRENRINLTDRFWLSCDTEYGRYISYNYNRVKNCFIVNNGPNNFELPAFLTPIIIKIIELLNKQNYDDRVNYTTIVANFNKSLVNGKIVNI